MTNWCWVWQYWFVRSNTTALNGDGCSSCANSGAACVKIHHPKTKYIITCRQGLSKFQRLLQMWQRKAALLGRNLEDTSSEALAMQESVAPEAIVYWCIKAVHLKSGNSARTRPGFFFFVDLCQHARATNMFHLSVRLNHLICERDKRFSHKTPDF